MYLLFKLEAGHLESEMSLVIRTFFIFIMLTILANAKMKHAVNKS